MADLISKLRESYTPTTGKVERLNVNKLIEDVVSLYRKKLKQKNIELILELCEGKCIVQGVPDQIKQVLINLIQNSEDAITHKEGGFIKLLTDCDHEKFIIKIMDNGVGIHTEDINNIFEPFYSTKLPTKGSGLGLSICYSILKKHNGNIFAQNTETGGACFTVELPLTLH